LGRERLTTEGIEECGNTSRPPRRTVESMRTARSAVLDNLARIAAYFREIVEKTDLSDQGDRR